MRNKLSYYSVILLVGLAVASGLIFVVNPFNGAPASAAPGTPAAAAQVNTTATSTTATSTATSTTVPAPAPATHGDDSQPGGTVDGDHHDNSNYPGLGGSTGNSTTTTSTSTYYSQHE